MRDQADELRQLVRQQIVDSSNSLHDSPDAGDGHRRGGLRKIVVSAGKGGVGTTTVAVNLAVSLGRMGCRTILVDADLSGADATWLCGLDRPKQFPTCFPAAARSMKCCGLGRAEFKSCRAFGRRRQCPIALRRASSDCYGNWINLAGTPIG